MFKPKADERFWAETFCLVISYFMLQKSSNPSYLYTYVAMSLYFIIDRSQQAIMKIANRLRHGKKTKARFENRLTFLIRCRNY